jgi:hypothetical protein
MPILVCLGLTFTAEGALAQCPNRGTVSDDQVSNSQGKPYQAKEVTKIVTYGSNETKRVVVTKSNLFRDSKGRIRVERFSTEAMTLLKTFQWIFRFLTTAELL